MPQVVALKHRPEDALKADVRRKIILVPKPDAEVKDNIAEALRFLGLIDAFSLQIQSNDAIPKDIPRVFLPNPRDIIRAFREELSPKSYCGLAIRLLDWQGVEISRQLRGSLIASQVKIDQSSLDFWPKQHGHHHKDKLCLFEFGLCCNVRFQSGKGLYNVPPFDARATLIQAGFVPGDLLSWAFCLAAYPELKLHITLSDSPFVVHPGTRVRHRNPLRGWHRTTGIYRFQGNDQRYSPTVLRRGRFDVDSWDSVFALFRGKPDP